MKIVVTVPCGPVEAGTKGKGDQAPAWFEYDGERIAVAELCLVWEHFEGREKVVNYDVWDGERAWTLSFHTERLSWALSRPEMREWEG